MDFLNFSQVSNNVHFLVKKLKIVFKESRELALAQEFVLR